MKILFLTRAYSEHAGGMERLSFELIQNVSKQPDVKSSVIAHQGSRATSPLLNLAALPKALRAAHTADVVHLGDPMLSFLGWMLKKLTGKPVAVTVHGLDIVYPNFLYQLYLKLFFRNFDHYFPISQHVGKVLHSKFQIPTSKFQILTPGISDRFYDPAVTREQLSKLLNRDVTDKKVLFTSGRLVKRKGHEWFIREVFPHLPENVIYVIAGDGPERQHLSSSEERSAAGRVRLLGKVSDDQLKILYNTADAFIMPNIPVENDVEGFGLVLLEAALCNRPVFAADLEGIPDAIHSGKNGILLPPQDVEAWIKPLTFIKPGESRQYTLAHFSWNVLAPAIAKSLSAAVPDRSA